MMFMDIMVIMVIPGVIPKIIKQLPPLLAKIWLLRTNRLTIGTIIMFRHRSMDRVIFTTFR